MLRATNRFAVVLVPMLLWAATTLAQSGQEDFRHYCAACHGQNGKGGGSWNGTKVPDLTRLSQANAGKFPTDEVCYNSRRSQPGSVASTPTGRDDAILG
jgi:Cytochrome c